MKLTAYSLIFLVILCCAPGKDNEAATDSTLTITTDTVVTQAGENSAPSAEEPVQYSSIEETVEPFLGITNNFPEFSMATLTSDSLELEVNNRIGQLLQAYDTMQYATVTSSYSWERPYCYQGQEGPCTMSVEKEEETKTWFFDRANQLRGFSSKLEGTSTATKSILYLFSNDELIAISEHVVDGSDAGVFVDQMRMLASSCPRCGMRASTFEGMLNGDVQYLNEKDLVTKQKEFYDTMPELIATLKAGRKNAKEDGDDFIFTVNRTEEGKAEQKSKAITYSVEFRVTKDLYPYYISKQ
ncbi:MAG: hypothetical protein HYZ44_07875 [Bacteroidetes bacterium]|nr:hypothetical protein [Bacteroidota bacterium]